MNTEKIAYFAGFFDGEGYVGYGFRDRLEIRIVNTFLPVLEDLKENFGGNVYTRSKTLKRHKIAHDWVLVGREKVIYFLRQVQPHLTVKKESVDFVLSQL